MNKSKTSNRKEPSASGAIVVISAPSGCGKTTIVDRLLNRHTGWMRSISVTTRSPRSNEKDGVHYFFITEEEFARREEAHDFLESAKVIDYHYGTPKTFVMNHLAQGKVVILEIDVQGAKKVKKNLDPKVPQVSIFVLPPSVKVLRERLEGRKTETPEQIQRRIEVAQDEIKEAGSYDYAVVNQNLDETVQQIEDYIEAFINERRK